MAKGKLIEERKAIEDLDDVLEQIKQSGLWMLRYSNSGISPSSDAGGFRWKPVGEWVEARDWDPAPRCGGGLHGQGPGGFGFTMQGTRIDLCQTGPDRVVVDGNKIKVRTARIIAVDQIAIEALLILTDGKPPVSLDLRGYEHPLPEKLASIGGDVDLRGYQHPLPEKLASIGGDVDLEGYEHPLPEKLASIGGYVDLRGYEHPLPEKLASIGGYVYLEGYQHPLPEKLASIGGYVDLRGYQHPLPEKLASIGDVDLEGYQHPLPEKLASIGGYVYLRGYEHPLPEKLASIGGYVDLRGYEHPLPKGLKVNGRIRKG